MVLHNEGDWWTNTPIPESCNAIQITSQIPSLFYVILLHINVSNSMSIYNSIIVTWNISLPAEAGAWLTPALLNGTNGAARVWWFGVECGVKAGKALRKDSVSNCHVASAGLFRSGPWFNIKMSSYQYRKSHFGDKTVVRSSYLQNGISYTGKMTSLYWIRAL